MEGGHSPFMETMEGRPRVSQTKEVGVVSGRPEESKDTERTGVFRTSNPGGELYTVGRKQRDLCRHWNLSGGRRDRSRPPTSPT